MRLEKHERTIDHGEMEARFRLFTDGREGYGVKPVIVQTNIRPRGKIERCAVFLLASYEDPEQEIERAWYRLREEINTPEALADPSMKPYIGETWDLDALARAFGIELH